MAAHEVKVQLSLRASTASSAIEASTHHRSVRIRGRSRRAVLHYGALDGRFCAFSAAYREACLYLRDTRASIATG
jgi:hypothetical protein